MSRLLTLQYYFTPRPDINFQYTKLSIAIITLLILAAIALFIAQKKYSKDPIFKRLTRSYPVTLFYFAVIFGALLFARETGIPYLSMRILWVLAAAYFVYWLFKVIISYPKKYQERAVKAHSSRNGQNRYLPKKKKRK